MNPVMQIYKPLGKRTTQTEFARFLKDMASLSIDVSLDDGKYEVEDGELVDVRCLRAMNIAREMCPVYSMGGIEPAAIYTGTVAVSITMDGLGGMDGMDCIIRSEQECLNSDDIRTVSMEVRGIIRAVDADAAVLDMMGSV